MLDHVNSGSGVPLVDETMNANLARVRNLDGNNMTVRQQVKSLLASVRMKQDLLAKQSEMNSSELEKSERAHQSQDAETSEFVPGRSCRSDVRNEDADFESIEIVTNHRDFESLLDEKLREESSRAPVSKSERQDTVKKKPFLKKGEGLARFRMKPRVAQTKRKTETQRNDNRKLSIPEEDGLKSSVREQSRSAPLIAFEQLEQKLNDSSFCSTSSMIARLMEDSIKSTPIKRTEFVEPPAKVNIGLDNAADRGMLDVIDEESSAYDMDGSEETLTSLLESRMLELEAEIGAFKTESARLSKLRSDYEKEYNQFCQERVALLEKIRVEHLNGARELEEEKGKLQQEKRAFEKHVREVRNRPTKEEKEEIRLLKEEIKLLKEEVNKKESRWAAAQARVRTEMKLLKDHNSALQKELNELKKSSKKKVMFAPVLKKSKSFSGADDVSKSADEHASLFESSLHLPPTSDSGVFSGEDFRSSNESCASPGEDEDDPSKEVSISELPTKSGGSMLEVSESTDSNGNREKVYVDGRKEIWYANGSVKKISPDGKITKTIFYNGDVEEVNADQNSVKYYHAGSQTWHSKFGNGLEMNEFPDGQVEKYHKGGTVEVISSDGTVFTRYPSGEKTWQLKDGSLVTINEGRREKRISFANGQVEIHNPEFKRREYPDGTTKTVYNASGILETFYPNGRLRLRSRDGTLISDTVIPSFQSWNNGETML